VARDVEEMKKLKEGTSDGLDKIEVRLTETFFTGNSFRVSNANSETFVLLLAQNNPKSLVGGGDVDLDRVLMGYNRNEFHHIYPRAYLRELGTEDEKINCLANFCLLTSAENKRISGKQPSRYFAEFTHGGKLDEILASAFLERVDFNDNLDDFRERRSKKLLAFANQLLAADEFSKTNGK
jgi:hypothetical protein